MVCKLKGNQMDKSEKKKLKKEFQDNEKASFENSLPMPRKNV